MIFLNIKEWFSALSWSGIVDIFFVIIAIWQLYKLTRGSGAAINIFVGIVFIYFLWKLSERFDLKWTSEILGSIINVGLIALIVIFQPEIRNFLLLIGSSNRKRKKNIFWDWVQKLYPKPHLDVQPIIEACEIMSKNYTGALIIIAKDNELATFIHTGEELNANISKQLLETIFWKNTPLHDGAVIINHNKIMAARCILPVSAQHNISVNLGLRHRSAIGITEQSDAIAIVVSEQNGCISYCQSGNLTPNVTPIQLKDFLESEFILTK